MPVTSALRLLLCDDQPLIRAGLRSVCAGHPDLEVVGEAAEGSAAVEAAVRLGPDVVIMDVEMPGLDGIEATRRIAQACPRVRVLVLSVHCEDHLVARALEAGAAGYALKDAPLSEIAEAVRAVAAGRRYLSPGALGTVVEAPGSPHPRSRYDLLTDREREVLKLLADGLSVREIALRLGRSVKTAEVHKYNLAHKLGVHRAAGLVKYAIAHGLIRVPVSPPEAYAGSGRGRPNSGFPRRPRTQR